MKRLFLSVAWLLGASMVHAQSGSMSLPAGTTLGVRTIDPIDTNYSSGTKFRAALADPVTTAHGSVVIPRGAPVVLSAVNIDRSSRIKGRDRIDLKVDSITFNGRSYPVTSTISE